VSLNRLAPAAFAIFLNVATVLPAGALPGYIGMYLDETRTSWCANGTVPYQIEVMFFAAIEGDGVFGYGFDLDIPSNLEFVSWDGNPFHRLEICEIDNCPPGVTGAFTKCLTGWVWLRTAVFDVTSPEPAVLEMIGHPENGLVGLANCEDEAVWPAVLTRVYINYGEASPECLQAVPTKRVSWGMVKTRYGDD
jgi:hypothetical protein